MVVRGFGFHYLCCNIPSRICKFVRLTTTHGFKRSDSDSCVYLKRSRNESFVYLLLYVDDVLIAAKSKDEIRGVKMQLSKEFEMKT